MIAEICGTSITRDYHSSDILVVVGFELRLTKASGSKMAHMGTIKIES